MKYLLLLAFFVSQDGKTFYLQSTSTMEFESKLACELAGAGTWETFKSAKSNAINLVAWCMAKDATKSSEIYRLNNVGR
ncbi:hypothetical protein [Bradyrhizobium sp. LB11.1]|uniref:hypothetical protein n=1 Tax=Bradyrhizobium sp. LB11.1 TaxID=3156326 RepID=UPI003397D238